MAFPNPWRGLKGLPAEVWVLSGVTLVNRMGTMALPFLVLYLTRHVGLAVSTAGLAVSVFGVGALVSSFVAGRLCDRVGAVRVIEVSLLVSGALLLLFPLANSFGAVLALTLLWSLASEAVRPASLTALTGGLDPEKRKAAIALNRLAINLGMSVGPALGGVLAIFSFPLLFVVDGATSIAAGVVLAVTARRLRFGGRPEAAPEGSGGPAVSTGALRDPRMALFLLASLLLGIVFFQHEAAMPVFLVRDLGLPETFYGAMFALNTLVIVALEVPLNLAMARWPHRPTLVLGSLLCAAGFGGMALVAGAWGVAATVIVWTFGEMVLFPGMAAYVADVAPPARRGEYMGVYAMTFGLAFTVGPWAGTQLLDRFGPFTLWSTMFAVGVGGAALMGLLGEAGAARAPAAALATAGAPPGGDAG